MNRSDLQSVRPIAQTSHEPPMAPPPSSRRATTPPPSDLLTNAHEKALLAAESAVVALRSGDVAHATSTWGTAEMRLCTQLEAVERLILPVFRFVDPLAAHRILHSHARLRGISAECAQVFAKPKPNADEAASAVHALRSHGTGEGHSMYRWADRHLDNITRGLLWTRLVGA